MTGKLITPTVFSRTILLAVFALAVLISTSQGQSSRAADQGNDPPNRVIFLHYDYMVKAGAGGHSHVPNPESLRMVVEAFRNHGITLHIDPQHTAIPEHRHLSFGNPSGVCDDSVNFYDLKEQYFQPRGNHTWHYAIFGHSADAHFTCGAHGGLAEARGYDFMVTMGEFFDLIPPELFPWIEGGIFMHELGHNLSLHHGGYEARNYKPNYISVMNYIYVYSGISSAALPGSTVGVSRRLDYSDRALPTLDENHLDENVGVSTGNNDIVHYVCSADPSNPTEGLGPGIGPIDWNCNGVIESDIQADINLDFDYDPNYPFTLLTGFDDWAQIHAFLNTPQYRNRMLPQNPEIIGCDSGRTAFSKSFRNARGSRAPF